MRGDDTPQPDEQTEFAALGRAGRRAARGGLAFELGPGRHRPSPIMRNS